MRRSSSVERRGRKAAIALGRRDCNGLGWSRLRRERRSTATPRSISEGEQKQEQEHRRWVGLVWLALIRSPPLPLPLPLPLPCCLQPSPPHRKDMLMATMHMDSSTTTPPWIPVQNELLHDLTPASSAPSPSHHRHLLPLRAGAAAPSSSARNHRVITKKRRPRPSCRQPTTYINADPASFRRMVHQVTGADHLPQPELLLARPAAPINKLSRSRMPAETDMLLPTLDTSAFLSRSASSAAAAPAPALEVVDMEACCKASTSAGGGGFPTLESWDHHAPLF